MFISLRKKIKYQSWHRGTRELDMILGNFFDNDKEFLDSNGSICNDFLQEDDALIYDWIFNTNVIVPDIYNAIISKIKTFYKIKGD